MNYRRMLTERDNLIIYDAGHGWLDEENERGYWRSPERRTRAGTFCSSRGTDRCRVDATVQLACCIAIGAASGTFAP